ncbi:bifunctional folylpolyglutamate synthase/dihydrofolate synthase [Clostridium sp. WCA-389-WT-23D1]|uniref:tetrahydrofolate synthase n=2 Tax=Clostridiaceae TaxID=31979 RepID=A0A7X2TAU4_9CLOT|nr:MULTISPECIES: folylpolyglutamate synthase/dihydrofolate synthase family protein [Clostridium]MCI6139415.1 bifunctional folylpolyglutamate synthase/dihydrofolate synthase [Clostridium sp.]MSS35244.1 bifunctional folylpolyglutamate synthase/dihydrofolate synthase [Clostridium porci]
MGNAGAYLKQIPMWTRKKNSLEDVRDFLGALGHPDREIPAIHVAGTNGKGSVCAFLTSMLKEAGYKTGTFISPHLVEVRERFLINGKRVEEAAFEESFDEVLKVSRRMEKTGYCHPTFFEFLFYMAMVIFKRQKVDVMVLETGMGGRLDTTNVLEKPSACVITSISMDHTQYLGDTLIKIAREKAGIIKKWTPVIFAGRQREISAVIEGQAFRAGSARYPVGREDFRVEDVGDGWLEISARMLQGDRLKLKIPFEAFYQAENTMLAVRTLDVLRWEGRMLTEEQESQWNSPAESESRGFWNITNDQIIAGIKKTTWPGRMEQAAPGIYLDGAHNPGGISAFLETAGEIEKRMGRKPYLLFGAVSDKDYQAMARQLCSSLDWAAIGVVHINCQRGMEACALVEVFEGMASCEVIAYEDARSALEDMRERSKGELLFCAGSLYLIGEIKASLDE